MHIRFGLDILWCVKEQRIDLAELVFGSLRRFLGAADLHLRCVQAEYILPP